MSNLNPGRYPTETVEEYRKRRRMLNRIGQDALSKGRRLHRHKGRAHGYRNRQTKRIEYLEKYSGYAAKHPTIAERYNMVPHAKAS